MKKSFALIILINLFFFVNISNLIANTCNLKVSDNNRFLVYEDGTPFFPMGDAGWKLPWGLNRQEAPNYLQIRKDQKFNVIYTVAFPMDIYDQHEITNVYGDQPFVIVSGKFDPTQPITTSGNDPNNATQYDYWDNLEYVIDTAATKGLYVGLLPCWGDSFVVDDSNEPSETRIFNMANAYTYGQWIGSRFSTKTNIIWMMGGDTNPEGYTNTFRKMAEGVADGVNSNDGNADYSTTFMSYHASRYSKSSSRYFPNDAFMDFNSIQANPEMQNYRIQTDYALTPAKPTWLFEGLYENRVEDPGTYGAWQSRFQIYQTVFAGGFGHTYGSMSIWDFDPDWETRINDPGGKDMQHLYSLMTSVSNAQFLTRIPDQNLLNNGDTTGFSELHGYKSSCIVATRTTAGDLAMVYCANGKNIEVKMSHLAGPTKRARWLNPRDGSYTLISTNVPSGSGAAIHTFDPAGSASDGNDWVLVLDSLDSEPEPIYPDPSTLHVSSNGRYIENDNGEPVLLQCDWGLYMPSGATASDVTTYINKRALQGFNVIFIQAADDVESAADYTNFKNVAGHRPFALQSGGTYDGRWDVNKPDANYWGLIDTIIDTAAAKGIYIALAPLPVGGPLRGGSAIRCMDRGDTHTCYAMGNWLGKRYANKTNIIWVAGLGDPTKYGIDISTQPSAIAKGIADGVNGISNDVGATDYSTTLMTYASERWTYSSSHWYNDEDWLDFNSVYESPGNSYGSSHFQIPEIEADYALTPAKPTWLFGVCMEHQRQSTKFTAPQCRFQMYQSFLAGGAVGITYGNRYCALMQASPNWQTELSSTAADQVQYAKSVLTPLVKTLTPDQSLLVGSTGSVSQGGGDNDYWAQSTIIQAARSQTNAVIYSAYGNNFTVKMSGIPFGAASVKAEWFNPRTGTKTLISNTIPSGSGAADHTFDPPGSPAQDNDAVLVLTGLVPEPTVFIGGLLFGLAFLRSKHN